MLKEQYDLLTEDQRALCSVSYLMGHPELQPEESKKIFLRMLSYDKNAHNVQETINQAKKSIAELKPQLDQIIGAMTALSGVIADYIPAEKYEEFCLAYQLPEELNRKMSAPKKNEEPDIAGSTSKKLPDIQK